MPKCSNCHETKRKSEFYTRPWGFNSWCKSCGREKGRIRKEPTTWWGRRQREEMTEEKYKKKRQRRLRDTSTHRVCCDCDKLKEVSQFHKGQYRCKKCRKL